MPSLLRIPWISRGWTPASGARTGFLKVGPSEQLGSSALLPPPPPTRTIWVISPVVPSQSNQGHQPYCPHLRTIWVISTVPPGSSQGHQPCCPSLGTIRVISPIVPPVSSFRDGQDPTQGAADPPVGQTGREEWEIFKVLKGQRENPVSRVKRLKENLIFEN